MVMVEGIYVGAVDVKFYEKLCSSVFFFFFIVMAVGFSTISSLKAFTSIQCRSCERNFEGRLLFLCAVFK